MKSKLGKLLKNIKFCDKRYSERNVTFITDRDFFDARITSCMTINSRLSPDVRRSVDKFWNHIIHLELLNKDNVNVVRSLDNRKTNALNKKIVNPITISTDFNSESRRLFQMLRSKHPELKFKNDKKKKKKATNVAGIPDAYLNFVQTLRTNTNIRPILRTFTDQDVEVEMPF